MKKIILLLVGIVVPMISFGTVLVDSDFEDGTMGKWVPKMSNECWVIDSSTTLQGSKNLRAVDLGIADSIYAYTNVTFDLSNYNYEWKFMMNSVEPTSGNKYWFWLATDKDDFNASDIKGYLVGVQYDEENDNLSVWKVNETSDVTKIIESDFDVGGSSFSVKVTRSSNGFWTLYYKADNSFDSMISVGTATDTSFTSLTTAGPSFTFSAGNSGEFQFDACTISREAGGGIAPPDVSSSSGTNVSVYVNEEISFDITADSAAIFGGLFSTNKPSGSTFAEQTGNFSLSTTFSWIPDTLGSYSAVFTSTNETGATDLIVNIEVTEIPIIDLWINELHYDNDSTDVNEGVEIAGKAGIDLSNYTIYAYNGSGGGVYDTEALTGAIPNEGVAGYGAVWFAVDIGVEETGSTLTTESLQLKGSGTYYQDFTWSEPSLYSHGLINDGQNVKLKGSVFIIN
jgi:hypothetical protein